LLLQAQEEANRLVEMAREKARTLTEEHELVQFAREHAQEIETHAHRQAEEILADTDEYIIDQLSELEEQLLKTLTTVRNGLRHVQETQPRFGSKDEKQKGDTAKVSELDE
jgi:vacuolar-type H+-ATPase subunit H